MSDPKSGGVDIVPGRAAGHRMGHGQPTAFLLTFLALRATWRPFPATHC
ncbi:MAG: hypothetical protein NXI18_07610 [Alphaproteobacteria bacterium]|nr:hypothetical protein [Alphaproteobacteria bacterium]